MLEKCIPSRGLSELGCLDSEMSTLSVRAPGMATTVLDTRALRLGGGNTALEGVRRNLFGCTAADREENKRFAKRELARDLELSSQKWGFDFANEKPLGGKHRFVWHLVSASAMPVALRRAPVAVGTNFAAPFPAPVIEEKPPSPNSNKTQRRITDFLKPRKRLSNGSKKSPGGHGHKHECGHGVHIRPPKVARLVQAHFKRPS